MKTLQSKLGQYTVFHQNSEEYHLLKRELFSQHQYYFESDLDQPMILDIGAHIGLATLYFKQLFPNAHIVAVEPNPNNFALLEKNVYENQLENVTLLQQAISDTQEGGDFFIDETSNHWQSTGSFHKGSWAGVQESTRILVETTLLSSLITQPIDFLKLDIEGWEQVALTEAQGKLRQVKELQFEFHPHPTQSLKKIVELLEQTHAVTVFSGTQEVPVKKAKGLVQVHAKNRKFTK